RDVVRLPDYRSGGRQSNDGDLRPGCRLELNSSADLNGSWPVERLCQRETIRVRYELSSDGSEVSRIFQIRSGILEVWMVEDIEEIERESKAHSLGNLGLFADGCVELPVRQSSEHTPSG